MTLAQRTPTDANPTADTDPWPAEEHPDWNSELDDAREIGRYVESLDESGEVDGRIAEDRYFGCRAVLRRVPIADLTGGRPDANVRLRKKEKAYALLPLETMPPLLVDQGCVEDGNHRLRVARRLGATHLLCYVVEDLPTDTCRPRPPENIG